MSASAIRKFESGRRECEAGAVLALVRRSQRPALDSLPEMLLPASAARQESVSQPGNFMELMDESGAEQAGDQDPGGKTPEGEAAGSEPTGGLGASPEEGVQAAHDRGQSSRKLPEAPRNSSCPRTWSTSAKTS